MHGTFQVMKRGTHNHPRTSRTEDKGVATRFMILATAYSGSQAYEWMMTTFFFLPGKDQATVRQFCIWHDGSTFRVTIVRFNGFMHSAEDVEISMTLIWLFLNPNIPLLPLSSPLQTRIKIRRHYGHICSLLRKRTNVASIYRS